MLKFTPVSGVKVVAAQGTAERLVSESSDATKLVVCTFQCLGSHGIMLGDSGVVYAAGATNEGLLVGDGTLASSVYVSATIDLLAGFGAQLRGVDGLPHFDLYDIWVDAETNADRVFWFGLKAG